MWEQRAFLWASGGASGCCEVVLQVPREACECSGHREQEVPLREEPSLLWASGGASHSSEVVLQVPREAS